MTGIKDPIKKCPILKNNNAKEEWAKFAYAIYRSSFHKPELAFMNKPEDLKIPDPGMLLPSNMFKLILTESNAPKDYEEFLKIFRQHQANGADLTFSVTKDDESRIKIMFPPDMIYDKLEDELKKYMPMIISYCELKPTDKAINRVMNIYESLD